ncbi:MAG: M23 family metallopeptidase, partial [Alphaproteobacteria bacterium]|nr:M23 family metallopeptidase [Alphaproteobacteria bacterium]
TPIEVASAAGNAPVDLRRGDTDAKMAQWDVVQLLVKRLPLAAPVHKHELKSGFGRRVDPFTGQWAVHDGVDLAGTQRSAILATGQGVVSFVGTRGPYGRTVEITHGLGLVTRYAHLRRTAVKQGEEVEVGQAIGEMGSSGRSTGPHLHYEVHFDGKPIDPELFLRAGQVVAKK